MKLEATTFRPREVVKHVLQTAAASLKKELTLEGCVGDDVPLEVFIINDFSMFFVYNLMLIYSTVYTSSNCIQLPCKRKINYLFINFK
jgi:hypothetical protein